MRVIAGKHRGRVLAEFRGDSVRPTPDRVKESLFQILNGRLDDARVLDLFCGSGALGIESLSRGAAEVVFNDVSKESLAILRKNLALVKENGTVYQLDFQSCLKRCEGQFDLIFSDPPYKERFLEPVCRLVKEQRLLKEGGLLLYESEREETIPLGWEAVDRRNYGRTAVYFLAPAEEKA